jgi:peptidoglycan hydrolase CwlO-like protein
MFLFFDRQEKEIQCIIYISGEQKRGGEMFRGRGKVKIISLAILVLINIIFTSSAIMAEKDSIAEIEDTLLDISEKERETLESLFIQVQEIEELEREREKNILNIKNMKAEIEDLDALIQKETINYENKLNLLKQILQSYQRMGPSSYIEIILEAENIRNLLRRINTLRDLTKNTGELLDSIDQIKNKLMKEKSNLDEKLNLLEEKENQLADIIEKGRKKVQELEQHLASLEEDREYYQERLDAIIKLMDELASLIKDISKEFANIIKEANLPEENVELRLTMEGMKGIIQEDAFNSIVQNNENLPEMVFRFQQDLVEVEFPQNNLVLLGSFVIVDEQTIKYQIEEGSFYGLVLKKETIDQLFKDSDLIFNLEPLLWNNTIEDVKIMEGYMELSVKVKLF